MHRRHASKKKQATADKHNTTYTPEVAVPHAEVADEIRRFQALLDQIHWSVLVTAGRIRVHIILSQHHFNPVSTTHMDRQTDGQTATDQCGVTDRQTDRLYRQKDRETDRQTEGQTDKETERLYRQTEGQTDRQTVQTDRQLLTSAAWQTDRQTDRLYRQKDRETERQRDRQTERQTEGQTDRETDRLYRPVSYTHLTLPTIYSV